MEGRKRIKEHECAHRNRECSVQWSCETRRSAPGWHIAYIDRQVDRLGIASLAGWPQLMHVYDRWVAYGG